MLFEAEPEPYLITIGLRVAGPLADAEAPTLVAALARHELCLSVHEPEIRHVEPGETSLIVRFAVSGTSRHTARRAAIAVAGAPLAAFREGLGSGRALLDDRLIVSRAADLVGQ